jgi:hypothetical protein
MFCWEALMRFKTIMSRHTPGEMWKDLSGLRLPLKKTKSDADHPSMSRTLSTHSTTKWDAHMAQYVYETYLSPAAELQIAMDGSQLRVIEVNLRSGTITSALFEEVEATCVRAMTDSRNRFYESSLCR